MRVDGSLSLSLLEATLELGLDVFSRVGATTDAAELEGVVVELSSASWAFLPFWPFFFLVMVYIRTAYVDTGAQRAAMACTIPRRGRYYVN
jgi:hypothetical protein